jgi:hypothetical protein
MYAYMMGYAEGPAFSAVRICAPTPLPPPISSAMMSTISATATETRSPVAMNGAALGRVSVANRRGPRNRSTAAVSRATGSSDLTP